MIRSIRVAGIAMACVLTVGGAANAAETAPTPEAIIKTYADVAEATYSDALKTAQALDAAVDDLIAWPSESTLLAARAVWRAARVPYQQSEAFRFGNPIVDEWEGRVNAWPLDEGLIDYVDASYGTVSDQNKLYTMNVIAHSTITVNGKTVDASVITPKLISDTLQEADDVEANVASGYHAIEFLLWGQDLHGTGAGAGMRPASDYDTAHCTGGHCDRRVQYLKAATTLLVSDLEEMVGDWAANGAARANLTKDPKASLSAIFTGMGSLSYGELAGERMRLGLMLHDPEEEQDCFSDNTYNSHFYDQVGIRNVYYGHYKRVDGSVVSGPSVADLVRIKAPAVSDELDANLNATTTKMAILQARGEGYEAYDQMIAEGNTEGNAVVQAAVDALITQARSVERAVAALDLQPIKVEGSDSLDNPNAVFQ